MSSAASVRVEKDLLGTLEVPADAYYGVQTLRAVQNFRLSGVTLSHYPKLVIGLAMLASSVRAAIRRRVVAAVVWAVLGVVVLTWLIY